MLRDFLIALSFSNMIWVNLWIKFFYKNQFHTRNFPTGNSYLALIFNELLITLLVWLIILLVRRLNNSFIYKVARFVVCLEVILFLNLIAIELETVNLDIFKAVLLILIITLICFKLMTKTVLKLLLILTPFVVIIFGQAVMGIIQNKNQAYVVPKPVFSFTANPASPRVLWLIFDEMDQRIAFAKRPKTLRLPEFDRIKNQALYATNAIEPSNSTDISIPALIDGRKVSANQAIGLDRLVLTYEDDNTKADWGSQPNVFSEAKALKINTAFVGEYLPYPRLIGKDLSFCTWSSYTYDHVSTKDTFWANVSTQLFGLIFVPSLHYQQHKIAQHEILENTKKLVGNSNYGLIVIHFPVPHGPFYYRHWWEKSLREGYSRNLIVSDKTMGELRHVLEQKGLWDKTTILISADHGLRDSGFDGKIEPRVPYILKLAGQTRPVTFNPSFSSVLSKNLILNILRKDIKTPDDLVKWLVKHRTDVPPVPNLF
jgi:hypothetical protein